MSPTDHRHATGPSPRRATAVRAAAGAMVLLVGSLLAIGCGGSSNSSPADTTTTTSPVDLQYAAYADPAKPISVEAGKRFAIILPADPGSGWHWVMTPIDTSIVIALGSEFRDDEGLRSKTRTALTTTTLDPAAPATTTAPGAATTPQTPAAPTTAAIPLVQVLSFAGRGVGTTTIGFRYERIGTTEARPITVTFTVNVAPLTVTTTR